MILLDSEEVRRAEQKAIACGYSSQQMIEKAGTEVFRQIRTRILHCTRPSVLVLCGKGNNGKDGTVVAAKCEQFGFPTQVFSVASDQELSSSRKQELQRLLHQSTVIIDALLGMGQFSAPYGVVNDTLRTVNDFLNQNQLDKKTVIALDVPSGIDADTGKVFPLAVKADFTVCIQWVKPGLLQFPARDFTGQISVVDIGLEFYRAEGQAIRFYDQADALRDLAPVFARHANSHKGSFGKVFVYEGIPSTAGASDLSAVAALRVGAPLVFKVGHQNKTGYRITPEVMSLQKVKGDSLSVKDCLVIGPGFGLDAQKRKLFWEIINVLAAKKKKKTESPSIVFDADALTLIASASAKERKLFNALDKSKTVMTPHPKEAAVLLEKTVIEVESDRYLAVQQIADTYGVGAVLLKGAATVVCCQNSATVDNAKKYQLTVHCNGHPKLATGGSGDVLAGMLAGLFAQLSFEQAVNVGVYLHAQTATVLDQPVIKALDIVETIPKVLSDMTLCR